MRRAHHLALLAAVAATLLAWACGASPPPASEAEHDEDAAEEPAPEAGAPEIPGYDTPRTEARFAELSASLREGWTAVAASYGSLPPAAGVDAYRAWARQSASEMAAAAEVLMPLASAPELGEEAVVAAALLGLLAEREFWLMTEAPPLPSGLDGGSPQAGSYRRLLELCGLPSLGGAQNLFLACAQLGDDRDAPEWRSFCSERAALIQKSWGVELPEHRCSTPEWGCEVFGACEGFARFRTRAVEGPSMLPTFADGDRIFVGEYEGPATPSVGEMVVLRVADGATVIKRVVAGPGAMVAITDEEVVVDGQNLRSAADAPCPSAMRAAVDDQIRCGAESVGDVTWQTAHGPSPAPARLRVRVPAAHVFVLGDGRDRSNDSRSIGPVPLSDVVGRVFSVREWAPREP